MPNRINLGMLSRAELELIRAKIAGGSFDELDAGALLDHIDAISDQHEALVQSSSRDGGHVDAPRRYRGFAGHFIGSARCRFHITTEIGDVIVSTVGAYVSSDPREQPKGSEPWAQIGIGRKYETMVFALGSGLCKCGCGEREIDSYREIDFRAYNNVKSATDGHEAMCVKWREGIAPPREPEEAAETAGERE